MTWDMCQSSAIFIWITFTLSTVKGEDYCNKDCQDYFPGPQFEECVTAHIDNPSCGIPKAFIGILVIAIIVFIVALVGAFVRCCILATVLSDDHQRRTRSSFAELGNNASVTPIPGWGRDFRSSSNGPMPQSQSQLNGPIHTTHDPNPYRQPQTEPLPPTYPFNCNSNYGYLQEELAGKESQPPPSYDEVVQGALRK